MGDAGHPVSPEALAGEALVKNFSGHGMRWDNSGKNAHYGAVAGPMNS